ncbi:hypothetical protein DNTS_025255 [Danionella cerebrum]|uniref:Cerebellar degeneration-related protein 2-like n=1 Tax=Danionella cerebrum TaxID=2873325 RepID=A0A553Q1E6_9TELE|nr:hypothetical protein DNTS_025255 [Danionella translucida]TRY83758.1 hypothetical protein DNTS_025255 [Danionella translucida]TRY83759.1 hypothetical protein DNTS_025255 [Danionella translucida]
MLTDAIEEDLEMKEEEEEEEGCYGHQGLERDLHLAAELGKTLLERNRVLEDSLEQMILRNQEQMREIEYLFKQGDQLRAVNDQHTKVHEQLEAMTQDLEQKNQKLLLENRAAQLKILRLSETVEGLQNQVEQLHAETEKIKVVSADQNRSRTLGAAPERKDGDVEVLTSSEEERASLRSSSPDWSVCSRHYSTSPALEEDCDALLRSVHALLSRLMSERVHKASALREHQALLQKIHRLELRAEKLEVYEEKLEESEAQIQELRLLLRSREIHHCRCWVEDEEGNLMKEIHEEEKSRRSQPQEQRPLYRALFEKIFGVLQRSKQELNRAEHGAGDLTA